MKRLRFASAILDAIEEVRQLPINSGRAGSQLTVCFKGVSGQIFGHMQLPTYVHVKELAAKLRKLGYGVSILHPQDLGCDFVFEDLTPPNGDLGDGDAGARR